MKNLALGFLFIYSAAAATLSDTGGVKGSVRDSSGKVIPGIIRVFISHALPVGAIKRAAPPVQTGPQVTARFADKEGNFSVGNLAPGVYIACAAASTPGYLDPCQWASSAPTFTITAGQIVPNLKIALAPGAVVPIRVNDSAQKSLKQKDEAVDGELQVQAVTSTGHHYHAVIVAQDDKGRDHSITVPYGMPVSFQVFSPRLTVSESSGKLFAPGGLTVTIPPGTVPAPLILTITGAK